MELFQQNLFQMLTSPYAFLLDFTSGTISSVVSNLPRILRDGYQEQQCHLVCCAGGKGRSRAAERLLFCHKSPVVLAGTPDAHCTLIRARKSSVHLSLCINALAFKVTVENVSKADSKTQTINNTLFWAGLFLRIISRPMQKEEPVCLWNIK